MTTPEEGCSHDVYVWASPAGSSYGIHLCQECDMPSPADLNKLNRSIESMTESLRRARRAAEQLSLLMVGASDQSERFRLKSKIEGVRLVESYISEEMRMLHNG